MLEGRRRSLSFGSGINFMINCSVEISTDNKLSFPERVDLIEEFPQKSCLMCVGSINVDQGVETIVECADQN